MAKTKKQAPKRKAQAPPVQPVEVEDPIDDDILLVNDGDDVDPTIALALIEAEQAAQLLLLKAQLLKDKADKKARKQRQWEEIQEQVAQEIEDQFAAEEAAKLKALRERQLESRLAAEAARMEKEDEEREQVRIETEDMKARNIGNRMEMLVEKYLHEGKPTCYKKDGPEMTMIHENQYFYKLTAYQREKLLGWMDDPKFQESQGSRSLSMVDSTNTASIMLLASSIAVGPIESLKSSFNRNQIKKWLSDCERKQQNGGSERMPYKALIDTEALATLETLFVQNKARLMREFNLSNEEIADPTTIEIKTFVKIVQELAGIGSINSSLTVRDQMSKLEPCVDFMDKAGLHQFNTYMQKFFQEKFGGTAKQLDTNPGEPGSLGVSQADRSAFLRNLIKSDNFLKERGSRLAIKAIEYFKTKNFETYESLISEVAQYFGKIHESRTLNETLGLSIPSQGAYLSETGAVKTCHNCGGEGHIGKKCDKKGATDANTEMMKALKGEGRDGTFTDSTIGRQYAKLGYTSLVYGKKLNAEKTELVNDDKVTSKVEREERSSRSRNNGNNRRRDSTSGNYGGYRGGQAYDRSYERNDSHRRFGDNGFTKNRIYDRRSRSRSPLFEKKSFPRREERGRSPQRRDYSKERFEGTKDRGKYTKSPERKQRPRSTS